MRVKICTLGCKVNQYESQAIGTMLERAGIARVEENENADIVIVNSCTVTAVSDQKVRKLLRREKKENPSAVMVLTGCMAQAFPEKSQELEEADIILGTSNRARLLEHILSFLSHRQRIIDISPHQAGEAFESMEITSFAQRTRAYIKIQDGCDRFCAYCIIPYARGRVRSKPIAELRQEAMGLGENGYRELVLTGINLSCYGQDQGLSLCDAVEAACAPQGICRVRLGSLEPELLSPEIIERLASNEKLCPQFHLSLQSGCDETLKRMNRHYTGAQYRQIVENLRKAFPGAAITTDIMVGFPGETEEEFMESLSFVKEISFAQAHVFAYSRRPGTKACNMENQVENRVKEERSRIMSKAVAESQSRYYNEQLGRVLPVLFEQGKEKNLYEGHTASYIPVLASGAKSLKGQLCNVEITEAYTDFCRGVPV